MGRKCITIVLLFCAYNILTSDAKEAPFINKCKAEDSECIKESAQTAVPILTVGIPSLGVDPLDPMSLDKVNASTSELQLLFTDVAITGLKSCIVKYLRRDVVKSTISMEARCALEVNGEYDISGQLLAMPITGRGKIKISIKNANVTATVKMENKQKDDGKTYWHIKDWKYTFELKDKAAIVFDDLFKENKALGPLVQEVIHNNSNEVVMLIGNPIIDAITVKVMKSINQFYDAVPSENLALD